MPNWSAVQSRFGIRRPEAPFVYALTASRYGQCIALVAYSDDGVIFTAAAVAKGGREAPEVLTQPIRRARCQDVGWKLPKVSPVAAYHRRDIEAWSEHVRPPVVPEIVSIAGPETHVLRLLRKALGLTGDSLRETVDRAKLLRVTPAQYHELSYWAPRFARVRIGSYIHDARA